MAKISLTKAVEAAIVGKDRVELGKLARELEPVLGYAPGHSTIAGGLSRLGWIRELAYNGRAPAVYCRRAVNTTAS